MKGQAAKGKVRIFSADLMSGDIINVNQKILEILKENHAPIKGAITLSLDPDYEFIAVEVHESQISGMDISWKKK